MDRLGKIRLWIVSYYSKIFTFHPGWNWQDKCLHALHWCINGDKGLLSNEKLNKYSVRLNIWSKVFDWFKAGVSTNLNYSIRNRGDNKTFTGALRAFLLVMSLMNLVSITLSISITNTLYGRCYQESVWQICRYTYINAIGYAEITPFKGLSLPYST